jgi:hypothetical protein
MSSHTEAAVPSKQVHALESFFDEFEQCVAKLGRDVVAVTVVFVYVSQKVIAAAAEAVKTEAQASVSALAHATARGATRATRRKRDRLTIMPSIRNSFKDRGIKDKSRGYSQDI